MKALQRAAHSPSMVAEMEAELLETKVSTRVTVARVQIRGQAPRRQCLITVTGTTADMMAVVVGSLMVDGVNVMVNASRRPHWSHCTVLIWCSIDVKIRSSLSSIRHFSQESFMSLHGFLRIARHILPLLILSRRSTVEDLSREPTAETGVQDGPSKIHNRKISAVKR